MKEVKRKGYRNYTFRYKKIQKDTCSISEGRLNMVSGKYNVNSDRKKMFSVECSWFNKYLSPMIIFQYGRINVYSRCRLDLGIRGNSLKEDR